MRKTTNAAVRHRLMAAALLASAAACAPIARPVIDHRGYIPDEVMLSSIRPGIDNQDSVATRLGTPSTQADFDGTTWYYISAVEEKFLYRKPKITDEKVVAVKFDKDGLVSQVTRYDTDDMQKVSFVDRETPTKGKELSFLEQMFGNFGRISATDTSSETPTPRN